jgi:hypothetical protein
MIMRFYLFSRLVKSKSHPAVTPSARREYCARHCRHLMLLRVIVAVEFVVYHVVDAASLDFLSRLKLFTFVCHVGLLLAWSLLIPPVK